MNRMSGWGVSWPAVALTLSLCATGTAAQTPGFFGASAELDGEVVGEDGSPVNDVVVSLLRNGDLVATDTTDSRGRFRLRIAHALPGDYRLEVRNRSGALLKKVKADSLSPGQSRQQVIRIDGPIPSSSPGTTREPAVAPVADDQVREPAVAPVADDQVEVIVQTVESVDGLRNLIAGLAYGGRRVSGLLQGASPGELLVVVRSGGAECSVLELEAAPSADEVKAHLSGRGPASWITAVRLRDGVALVDCR